MALEYTSEIRHIFSEQKYQTMEEFLQIKRNMNKKKAYGKYVKYFLGVVWVTKVTQDTENSCHRCHLINWLQ